MFDRHLRSFKGPPGPSRIEQFLEWAEEIPDEVVAVQQAEADEALKKLLRQERGWARGRASARRQQGAEALSDVPFQIRRAPLGGSTYPNAPPFNSDQGYNVWLREWGEYKRPPKQPRDADMDPIERSPGLSRSEQILARLCDRAFLPLWCYPNLYRAPGKELCDVLVVFGDDTILFSDKSCAYPNTGDPQLDWHRWESKTIKESARQLRRAERWLRERPTEVYLDTKGTKRFPLPINPQGRFHQIIVAKDARPRRSGSHASLAIHAPMVLRPSDSTPFEVYLSDYEHFVHVLDDTSLPVLLGELDTAVDFLEYLTKKKEAFASGQIQSSFGEEETLAVYLTSTLTWTRNTQRRAFPEPQAGFYYIISGGHWDELRKRPEYGVKKAADRVSYLWDSLLHSFGAEVHRGEAPNPMGLSLPQLERIGRQLASESRLQRRGLAGALIEAQQRAKEEKVTHRTVLSRARTDFAYVFSFVPQVDRSLEDYRKERRSCAMLYGLHSLRRTKALDKVLVIATESTPLDGQTFDFVVVLRHEEDDELAEIVTDAQAEYGWHAKLQDLELRGQFNREYPKVPAGTAARARARAVLRDRKRRRKVQKEARKKSR